MKHVNLKPYITNEDNNYYQTVLYLYDLCPCFPHLRLTISYETRARVCVIVTQVFVHTYGIVSVMVMKHVIIARTLFKRMLRAIDVS